MSLVPEYMSQSLLLGNPPGRGVAVSMVTPPLTGRPRTEVYPFCLTGEYIFHLTTAMSKNSAARRNAQATQSESRIYPDLLPLGNSETDLQFIFTNLTAPRACLLPTSSPPPLGIAHSLSIFGHVVCQLPQTKVRQGERDSGEDNAYSASKAQSNST